MAVPHPYLARSARRATAVVGLVTASMLALTGCFNTVEIDPADFPVGLDDAQSATLQITAQGEFYEPGTATPYEGGWFGSGFIISRSGLALTNNHVAAGATSFEVRPGGGTGPALSAEVVATSECLDLAVLQLPAGNSYPFMAWRQADIAPALDVYSAGFPNGTPTFTLTGGIVNTANQALEFSWASVDAGIEHDARIRGGNSGGPLIDEFGKVVGVNYAGDDLQDYNYAIAREQVLSVLDRMIAGENVASLGVNARALPPDAATGESLGVWVQSVQPGSPAEAAGIQAADIIVALDGAPLALTGTMQEYCDIVERRGPGATYDLVVARPLTGEVLEGQVNGNPLVVTGSSNSGGVEEFMTVSDDTGALTLDVPTSWSEVLGYGYSSEDGTPWETIIVAPDIDAFLAAEGSGLIFVASEEWAGADPARFEEQVFRDRTAQGCTSEGTKDYYDGYYTGLFSVWTCPAGWYYHVDANAEDGTHYIRLAMQGFTEFEATTVLDRVLSTFIAQY